MVTSHLQTPSFERTELPPVGWRAAVDALDDWSELRLWRAPDGTALIGIGAARVFDAPVFHRNVQRFRGFVREATDETVPAFVTSAFDTRADLAEEWREFRPCEVVVPRVTVSFAEDRVHLFTCEADSASEGIEQVVREQLEAARRGEPDAPSELQFDWEDRIFEARVSAALDRLHSVGPLEKVVVARRLAVTASRAWRTPATLATLSRRYPGCFEFAVRSGASTFLGATPERLVRVRDGRATTGALAGSARRGASVEEDDRLGRALLESCKDRDEHDVVIRMITSKLEPISGSVDAAEAPELMKLSNVQHLYTPIEARLAEDVGVGEVARRLHPTPAVGGMPRQEAGEAIRALEDFDRGLYAGFVGWIDSEGNGDVSVSIRSGLLRGERALLYAGSGIVPDSEPSIEVAETRAKLAAMLDALRGEADA